MLERTSATTEQIKKFFRKGIYFFLEIGILLMVSACAYHMVPASCYIQDGELAKVTTEHRVSLVNDQPRTGEKELGVHWNGDFNQFADTAIIVLKDALGKNDVIIINDADKLIKLSVNSASVNMEFWDFRADISLKVETGSGLRKDFTGYQIYAFGAQSTWAMERAITYAVMEILKDPDILSYLK